MSELHTEECPRCKSQTYSLSEFLDVKGEPFSMCEDCAKKFTGVVLASCATCNRQRAPLERKAVDEPWNCLACEQDKRVRATSVAAWLMIWKTVKQLHPECTAPDPQIDDPGMGMLTAVLNDTIAMYLFESEETKSE